MKNALLYILTAIISNPDEISVEEVEDNGVVEFRVKVPKEEIGKVIGKEGKIIRAIRNVLKIPAIKQQKKIQISIVEE